MSCVNCAGLYNCTERRNLVSRASPFSFTDSVILNKCNYITWTQEMVLTSTLRRKPLLFPGASVLLVQNGCFHPRTKTVSVSVIQLLYLFLCRMLYGRMLQYESSRNITSWICSLSLYRPMQFPHTSSVLSMTPWAPSTAASNAMMAALKAVCHFISFNACAYFAK